MQNLNWVVIVDLGLLDTSKYLYRGFTYAEARQHGERQAKRDAVEQHAPTSYCDVYVVAEGDPSLGNLTPEKVSLVCCSHDEAQHYVGATQDGRTGRWCRGWNGLEVSRSASRRGRVSQCGCAKVIDSQPPVPAS